MYIHEQPYRALGALVGPFEGTFTGTIRGDKDSTATIKMVLTDQDNRVSGQITLGKGLKLGLGGFCVVDNIDLSSISISGQTSPDNPRYVQTSKRVTESPVNIPGVKSVDINVTIKATLSSDGNTITADVTFDPLEGVIPAIVSEIKIDLKKKGCEAKTLPVTLSRQTPTGSLNGYIYDRQLSWQPALDKAQSVNLRSSQRYANFTHFPPEQWSLHGLGWTLPDIATRQAQVDAAPFVVFRCKVDAYPQLKPIEGKLHIDIGGEGRYPEAYNLNPSSKGTVPPWTNKDIPNHVCGVGESIPVPSGTVDYITLEGVPMSPAMISEIARVIKKTGHIRLLNPKAVRDARRWHRQVANAAGLPFPAALPEEMNIKGEPIYVSRMGTYWKHIPLGYHLPYVFDCYTVQPGNWLSTIAERLLGNLNRWEELYKLNLDVIGPDPNLIKEGQVLRIPPRS
jgi:hypothetical protein